MPRTSSPSMPMPAVPPAGTRSRTQRAGRGRAPARVRTRFAALAPGMRSSPHHAWCRPWLLCHSSRTCTGGALGSRCTHAYSDSPASARSTAVAPSRPYSVMPPSAAAGAACPPPAGAPRPSAGSTPSMRSKGAHRSLWVSRVQASSPPLRASAGSTPQNHFRALPSAARLPVMPQAARPSKRVNAMPSTSCASSPTRAAGMRSSTQRPLGGSSPMRAWAAVPAAPQGMRSSPHHARCSQLPACHCNISVRGGCSGSR